MLDRTLKKMNIDKELKNYINYNWSILSKKYQDALLLYGDISFKTSSKKPYIDIEQEFKQISSYGLTNLQKKYELILSFFKSHELENDLDLENPNDKSFDDYDSKTDDSSNYEFVGNSEETNDFFSEDSLPSNRVSLTIEQVERIKNSLKKKKEIIDNLISNYQNAKKDFELKSASYEKTINKLNKRQSDLLNLLDSRLNDNTPNNSSLANIQNQQNNEIEELTNQKENLVLKNNDLTKLVEEQEEKIRKYELHEKINLEENSEKLKVIKELSQILKSSKFDEDLIKRLQKQLRLNQKLLLRIEEYEKIENHYEKSSSEVKRDFTSFLKKMMPNIELFRNALPTDEHKLDKSVLIWTKGFKMVYNRIFDSIEESSITPIIPEQGDLFDPNYHEAIEVEESDVFNKDEIIEVQTYGYKYENILIMPAKVKISKSKGKN